MKRFVMETRWVEGRKEVRPREKVLIKQGWTAHLLKMGSQHSNRLFGGIAQWCYWESGQTRGYYWIFRIWFRIFLEFNVFKMPWRENILMPQSISRIGAVF